MNQFLKFTGFGVICCVILAGCTKKNDESLPARQQSSEETLNRKGEENLSYTKLTNSTQSMVTSGTGLSTEANLLNSGDARVTSRSLWNLTSQRTPQAAESIILYLKKHENGLPDHLPSMEEMKKLESNPPSGDHWVYHYNPMLRCVRYLVLMDLPETRRAVSDLMERMEAKYGRSQTGRFLIGVLERERQQAVKDLEAEITPWKRGPLSDENRE